MNALLLLAFAVNTLAAETPPSAPPAAAPILAEGTTKTEWAAFMRKRIPALTVPASAAQWDAEQARLRRDMLSKVVYNGVPKSWYTGLVRVEWTGNLESGKGYRIRKLRYEGAPGMWIPALLYEPVSPAGKVPGVLNVNGHVGDPGKTQTPEQVRSIALAKKGVVGLHPEWLQFGELKGDDNQHNKLAYLNACGVSGLSVFYLAMKRGLDVLAEYPAVDPERIAMTGLSGGGWQTILLSSLDTRVAVSVPNAGYSGIDARVEFSADIGDLEQVPPDLLTVADFTHLTAMLAPRPTLLIYNAKDECCFKADHMAASIYEPALPAFALYDRAEFFRMYTNEDPGTHNYEKDNRLQLYAHLSEHFGLGWDNTEPETEGEIRSYDDLTVGIPATNATFSSLAESFLDSVPVNPAPEDGIELSNWQESARDRLKQVLRLKEVGPATEASKTPGAALGDVHVENRVLKTGEWSVPATILTPTAKAPTHTTIYFADGGRTLLDESTTQMLLDSGARIVAVDLLFQGECIVHPDNHYQYAMMIEATGERVLGQNVAQIASLVEWARAEFKMPVAIHSAGWTSGVAALCYGGLHRTEVHRLTTADAPATLKDIIRQRLDYKEFHTLLCFGLLREFDVKDLAALCQGMQVNVKKEI